MQAQIRKSEVVRNSLVGKPKPIKDRTLKDEMY
jgi:hypothetical protein